MTQSKVTKLRMLLMLKDISDTELAAKVKDLGGKSNASRINNIKLGKSDLLCYNTLVHICNALKVTPNDIIEGEWK